MLERPITHDGKPSKASLACALHKHRVAQTPGEMVTKTPRGLAILALVLENIQLILANKKGKIGARCLEFNKDDFVEVAPVAAGEAFDGNGIWSGVRNTAASIR